MAAVSVFPSFLLLLFGGQIGVPLGLPPLPEDRTMACVAPQDCIWYFSWSGSADPNPKSANQTEQLLAEPEVRDFIHGVGTAIGAAMKKGAPPTPQGKLLGAEGPKLIHTLLTHPAAAFISKFEFGPRGPDVAGGIVVGTGAETEAVKSTLVKLEQTLLGAAAPAGDESKWHKLPSPPGAPAIEWGFRDKYLIVGIGEGSADAISKRRSGEPPAWLSAIKKRLPVERVSTVHYLNVKKLIAATGPMMGPQGQSIVDALGLSNVQQFANVSGLDGTGCLSKSWVQVDGEPNGLLSLFGAEPLTATDLRPIPKDASFAAVARVAPARLWTTFVRTMTKIDAPSGEQLAAGIKQMEATLGFRLQEDLLDTLGDTVCVYNSPGEGGLIFTGLTVVVPVINHDRLAKSSEQLVQVLNQAMASQPRNMFGGGPTLNHTVFRKQKIFCMSAPGEGMPFALCWCVADKQLILSLSPQNIRAILSRDAAAESLADLPIVAKKLKTGSPLLITYQDTAGTLKITYPILQLFANMAFGEMQQQGLELDGSVLPSLASIIPHVEPGVGTLSREKDGLMFASQQSMPVDVTLSGLLPAWSGLMFFSLREVRKAQAVTMEAQEARAQAVEAEAESRRAAEERVKEADARQAAEKRAKEAEEKLKSASKGQEDPSSSKPEPRRRAAELQPTNP
jgi:hypothetical protein